MRRPSQRAALAALLLVAGCAGARAREHALWPQVASTWPEIRRSVVLGLEGGEPPPATAAAMNQIEGAVRAGDYELVRGVNWYTIEPLARRGVQVRVDSGEISEGVSISLLERIARFSEAMLELVGR